MSYGKDCAPSKEYRVTKGERRWTGWWRVEKMVDGKRYKARVRDGRTAKAIARAWNEGRDLELRRSTETGEVLAPSTAPEVDGLMIERFLVEAMHDRTLNHRENVRGHLTQFANVEGIVTRGGALLLVDEIDSHLLQRHIWRMQQAGKSPATINARCSAVRKFVHWAAVSGLREPEHWALMKPKVSNKRTRVISPREADEFKTFLRDKGGDKGKAMAAYICALEVTACRRDEMYHRKPDDVMRHPETGQWVLRIATSKNGDARDVPLSEDTAIALKRWLPWRDQFSKTTLRRAMATFRQERPDIKPFVLHDFRRTAATRLALGGATAPQLQAWMGHRTLAMTSRYLNLKGSELHGLLAILEDKPVAPS